MGENIKGTARAGARLANKRARKANPELVAQVFSYGAVDIDPSNLVVWVLLKGPPDALPRWFFPSGDPTSDEAEAFGLLDELRDLSAVVRQAFRDGGWPHPDVQVGFDSDERVGAAGVWNYFR